MLGSAGKDGFRSNSSQSRVMQAREVNEHVESIRGASSSPRRLLWPARQNEEFLRELVDQFYSLALTCLRKHRYRGVCMYGPRTVKCGQALDSNKHLS